MTARPPRIRARHPRLGGLILALSDDPQSTAVCEAEALGEERRAHRLGDLASPMLRVLHDRRIPGSRANIDHVAVTPTGVYVIDAKRYVDQRPSLRVEGGILRPRVETLMVGSRDRTKLVDGVLKQVDLVRTLVETDLPVTGSSAPSSPTGRWSEAASPSAGSTCCGRRSYTRAWRRTGPTRRRLPTSTLASRTPCRRLRPLCRPRASRAPPAARR